MSHWIKLTVRKPLSSEQKKHWYACVQQHLPSGMLHHTQIKQGDHVQDSSYYHKQTESGAHTYVIPLVRDLDQSEIHKVAHAWDAQFADVDFRIDYSQPTDHVGQMPPDVPEQKIEQVMHTWAKQQHAVWMADLIEKGWRYGVVMSTKQKTHPWLQPWESLPDSAQQPRIKAVKDLCDILTQFGYKIVQIPQA